MEKLLGQTVLNALALIWLMPAMDIGVTVHGGLRTVLVLSFLFSALSWALWWGGLIASVLKRRFDLVVLLFFGWWLLPTFCLAFTALFFPQYLSVDSAQSLLLGGFMLAVVATLIALTIKNPARWLLK